MKIYKILFSPTGGTARVADILCRELGDEIVTIDLSMQNFSGCNIADEGVAVIAMPSFGGRAPKVSIDRLGMIVANKIKAIAVGVYGNRAQEDTLIEIADTATKCGFEVIAGISAVAEHSIARRYAGGRPDASDAEELRSFAVEIKARLDDHTLPEIPGNRPYKKAGSGLMPKPGSDCTGCGICAEKCPVGAIDKVDPKRTDRNLCINCMRCASVCPRNARTVNPLMIKLVSLALKSACKERKGNILYL